MRVGHIVRSTLFLILAAVFVPPAYADHSWSVYHWARTSASFDLITVHSMTPEWDDAFFGSVTRWSQSNVLNLQVEPGDTSNKFRRRCSPRDGQIVACNLGYGYTGWLGIASINIDSNGHIVRGSAKMNDSYASYWDIPGERNHVTCQEIGHLFGLGHTSEDGSSQDTCMDYSASITSQWPNTHDYRQLESIYGHIDSYDSYDQGTSGGGGDGGGGNDGCNPKSPKCSGFIFPDGPPMGLPVQVGLHHEIWVAEDGRGGYWVHHVRVAPGARNGRADHGDH